MLVINVNNINIGLSLPDLPDNDVWFANNAGWLNYWKSVPFNLTANITPIVVPDYHTYAYDGQFVGLPITISAVDYIFCSFAAAQELQAQLTGLETSYKAMRTAMKTAGLIDESDT